MKWRIAILGAALFYVAACFGQTDSAIHVKAFPGTTVGTMVANAQQTCGTNASVPCILIIDASLAAYPAGSLPTLCGHCYIWDFRGGPPAGGGVETGTAGDLCYYAVTGNICGPLLPLSLFNVSTHGLALANEIVITDPPYNAKCDGSSDDSTAVQAAFNSGATIIDLPRSTAETGLEQCNFASTLTLPTAGFTGFTINGFDSALYYTGTGIALDLGAGYSVKVNDLFLQFGAATSSTVGIHFYGNESPLPEGSALILNGFGEIGGVDGTKAIDFDAIGTGESLNAENFIINNSLAFGMDVDSEVSVKEAYFAKFDGVILDPDGYLHLDGNGTTVINNLRQNGSPHCTICIVNTTGSYVSNFTFSSLMTTGGVESGDSFISVAADNDNGAFLGNVVWDSFTSSPGTLITGPWNGIFTTAWVDYLGATHYENLFSGSTGGFTSGGSGANVWVTDPAGFTTQDFAVAETSGDVAVTLPTPMSTTDYSVQLTPDMPTGDTGYCSIVSGSKTTTGFTVHANNQTPLNCDGHVHGK